MESLKWTTVKRKVNDLIPLQNNPRRISEAQRMKLIESLQKFNLVDIPVIDADDTVISGHQRLRALQAIGRGEEIIDVRAPNRKLTEKEKKQYNLLANTHFGEWDSETLGDFLEGTDIFEEFGFEEFQFKNVDEIIEEATQKKRPKRIEVEEDEFDEPVPEAGITVSGDIWELKSVEDSLTHRIICGDSTDQNIFQKLIEERKIDLVWTDPDYNMPIADIITCYENCKRYVDAQFWMMADKQAVALCYHAGEDFKSFFVHDFVNATMVSGNNPMQRHNLIAKFGNPKFVNTFDAFSTIVTCNTERVSKKHKEVPMAKKVELPGKFVEHYTDQGDIVLDIFLHSGSTLIACQQLKRNLLAIELNERYCDYAVKRWIAYMEQKKLHFDLYLNGAKFDVADLVN